MSGSFWKFSQDYSTESPLTSILNRAFIKVNTAEKGREQEVKEAAAAANTEQEAERGDESETHDLIAEEKDINAVENEELGSGGLDACGGLPETETEYKDYKPNLDVLNELLDDEESYTELMCSNFKLMVFFKYPEVLDRLVDYVTNERILGEMLEPNDYYTDHESEKSEHEDTVQDDEVDQEVKCLEEDISSSEKSATSEQEGPSALAYDTSCTIPKESKEQTESRRARMAAEMLSADVWPISSAIMENQHLLSKLWSMLDHSAPLSIISSTYFMKINERLLDMDIAAMIRFIMNQDNLVDRFLRHIDNPPLMDFLLKVISTDKPDTPTHVIGLLKRQRLIPKLLDHLSLEYSSSIQSAAGDFLKALITISANSNSEIASAIGPNELTRELVSPNMVEKLCNIMLKGGTSLSNGVGIVIELIRKNNSDYDFVQVMYTTLKTHPPSDRDSVYLGHLVKFFAQRLPEFNRILVGTKLDHLETPFGSIEPLGFERFKICELIAELLHCSNMGLLNEPKGELIVNERDIERENVLRLGGYGGSNVSIDQEEQQTIAISPSDENDLANRINDLNMASDSGTGIENGESGIIDDEGLVTPVSHSGQDAPSDDSPDEELSEEAIRLNPVIGDQLKIALHDNRIVNTILHMFFKFPWNNFLHNVVFDIVQQIFSGPLKTGFNRFLLADLFQSSHITEVIMDGDEKCREYEKETGLRLGYMGHLTLVAEEVAKFASYVEEMNINFSHPVICENLEAPRWREYTDVVLAETRGKYSTVLGDLVDDDGRENSKMIDKKDYNQFYNGDDIYHNSFSDHDDENYAEYSDLDGNRYYEYEDESGHTTRIHLNQLDTDEVQDVNGDNDQDTSNKFRNYMSHQLAKDYSGSTFSSDEEEEESQWSSTIDDHPSTSVHASELVPQASNENNSPMNKSIFAHQTFDLKGEEGEDDYMDPNDDGQSYAKPNHPLYSNMLPQPHSKTLYFSNHGRQTEEEEESDDSDEELIIVEGDSAFEDLDSVAQGGSDYALCRTSSKEDLKWDSPDQQSSRKMGVNGTMFNRLKDVHRDE